MGVSGVLQLEAYWKSALASGAHRLNPFEPSTFEGTLKAAVLHLDQTGSYLVTATDTPNATSLPAPTDRLLVTDGWVLFGRKRSGDVFLEDIRRLKQAVEGAKALPDVIRSLVERGDDTVRVRPEVAFRGLSSNGGPEGAFELYFPMPYNDEQVSIVQKLASNDGVVVQGPPGTGKTHTIANVICHYLAQGKRVLVTAKSESALAVVQEKLPERVRPLCVSLLSDERDGMRQFEHAVQTIADRVGAMNPSQAKRAIAAAEESLNQFHAQISNVDRIVEGYARNHMRSYSFQGKTVSPEEMAKLVLQQADEHQWFDDEPPAVNEPPFADEDVQALRRARQVVSVDLAYVGKSIPAPGDFPQWEGMLELHRDLVRATTIEVGVAQGSVLSLVDSSGATFERARALAEFLYARKQLQAKLASLNLSWVADVRARLRNLKAQDPLLLALMSVCNEIGRLEQERAALVPKAIEVPPDAELDPDFLQAVERQVQGKNAFSFFLGKAGARKLVSAVSIGGVAPKSDADWSTVKGLLDWREQARSALARWTSTSAEFGLEGPGPVPVESAFRRVLPWRIAVEDVYTLTFGFDAKLHDRIAEVFGKATAARLWNEGEAFVDVVANSLQAQVDKGRLAYATRRVQELLAQLNGHSGAVVDELRDFLIGLLGRPDVDESVVQTNWLALLAELNRLTALLPYLAEVVSVAGDIEKAGAPKWATRVRTIAASADLDPVVPVKWREAWNWRLAVMFLDRIDGHHKMRELFEERRLLSNSLARTYQDLVAEKTWLGVFENSPPSVRQALQRYLNAVQKMGAGTGKRAIRHRNIARSAMLDAYKAVPCWVLPQWRVSETIPPEVGLFDLVVIDEASQSDIWALPAILRGQKLLVVGDHLQVSPSAVGIPEARILDLKNRFLNQQVHGSEMTPDKSIYDLARVVFAGNSVMLREHFRCVPAIIEFSKREFYNHDIKPLRVPKANERLDPPLVDVLVKGGMRTGDLNKPEAKAVVDEIEAILADPRFNGRTIGVVTLLGTEQASYIHELISRRISAVDVLARKISVGPAPVFQGRERDIMMVSMVIAPGDSSPAKRADIEQRFNVAFSRARDRMYLFRSVSEDGFDEGTLASRVLRHFKQPFTQDMKKVDALRDKCDSGFEREMFDELVKLGYRVQPQVPSGGYRIDFVVEGSEGRRLAIECDGDKFHGPGQWSDDMARQRVLERAGWTFWRCFASSFVRRREGVLEDLKKTLAGLGIEPLGADSVDNTAWVHYKEVDPYGVDAGAENVADEDADADIDADANADADTSANAMVQGEAEAAVTAGAESGSGVDADAGAGVATGGGVERVEAS